MLSFSGHRLAAAMGVALLGTGASMGQITGSPHDFSGLDAGKG